MVGNNSVPLQWKHSCRSSVQFYNLRQSHKSLIPIESESSACLLASNNDSGEEVRSCNTSEDTVFGVVVVPQVSVPRRSVAPAVGSP